MRDNFSIIPVEVLQKEEGGYGVIFGQQMHEKKSVADDPMKNYHIREITNINIVKDLDEYINGNKKWNAKNHVSI